MPDSPSNASKWKERLTWKQATAYLFGAAVYGGLLWIMDHFFYMPLPHESVLAWSMPFYLFVFAIIVFELAGWFSNRPILLIFGAVVVAVALEMALIPIARLVIS